MPYPSETPEISGPKLRRVPTISRVTDTTIIELVYDADDRKTGLVVSRFGGLWNLEQEVRVGDDILVPYSPQNNLIVTACVLLPSAPSVSGSKAELVADIEAFLHRYVDLSPIFEKIAAHYILLTWLHDRFSDLGYLRLRGEFGSGKTRGLMVIGSLCYRPFFASAASTVSPIFHTLDSFGGTLVMDEADLPYSDARADLVKILNNGTMPGMPVLRTMQNRNKEFDPRAFRVFGPKLVAMRRSFDDPALESRFITEDMGVRALRPDIPIHLPRTFNDETLALRNRLLHYRLCNLFATAPSDIGRIEGVAPRINQTAQALLSLVDDATLRQDIQRMLIEQDERLKADRREATDAQVLKAAYEAFCKADARDASIGSIADIFNSTHSAEYSKPVSNKWIGHVLRRQLHLVTEKSRGTYVVRRAELPKVREMAARLGIVHNPQESPTT